MRNVAAVLLGVSMALSVSLAGAAVVDFVEAKSGVAGLSGVSGVVISPDGLYLYGVGAIDDAVVVFQRNSDTGKLTFVESHTEGDPGPITGLKTPIRTVVSPDGFQLYSISLQASDQDQFMAAFGRNRTSGRLTFQQSVGVNGLTLARALAGSPDGTHLYVVAAKDVGSIEHLVEFKRDSGTGNLSYIGEVINNTGGVTGLANAAAVVVSPDGKHVYVSGTGDNAVSVFFRDSTTGLLNFVQAIKNGVGGVSGLQQPGQLTLSGDGRHVYVAGTGNDAVTVFERDAATGMLSFIEALANGQQDDLGVTVSGLNGVYGIAVSPEGSQVYATSTIDHALTVFRRDPMTGRLTVAAKLQNNQGVVDGLGAVTDLAVSADGQNIYTADTAASKIGVFQFSAADLNLVMTADAANANAGSPLGYMLTITNNGPADASNSVMTDQLPDALSLASAVPSQGTCNHAGNAVTCHLGILPAGSVATIALRATVKTGVTVSNGAQIAADQRDPHLSDNYDSVAVPGNTPPIANNDSAKTNRGIPVTINMLANDSDAENQQLMIAAVDSHSAKGGTALANEDGTVTYTPPADFTGTDSFHYTVSDGHGGTATALVNVLVNTPPVAIDDSVNSPYDTAVTIFVLVNDYDGDGDDFTISAVDGLSAHGGMVMHDSSTVTYTPPAGFTGTDTFSYTITDVNGGSGTAEVTVNVLAGSPVVTPASNDTPKSNGGNDGGGGSLDWLMLLLLGASRLRVRYQLESR